ncbi:MAG TPA: hypothetical protein VGN39_03530 [Terriglobales bacterium]|nr:hypothetical protein [Terriglobales bacterium]
MQFKVNGQDYFLNFVEDEGRWYVFAPTLTGVQRIPIYVDVPKYERFGFSEKGSHKTQTKTVWSKNKTSC